MLGMEISIIMGLDVEDITTWVVVVSQGKLEEMENQIPLKMGLILVLDMDSSSVEGVEDVVVGDAVDAVDAVEEMGRSLCAHHALKLTPCIVITAKSVSESITGLVNVRIKTTQISSLKKTSRLGCN